jgi:hypothetical protein
MQEFRLRAAVLCSLLSLTAAVGQELQLKNRLNLNSVAEKPEELKRFKLTYVFGKNVLFLFGDGRVVLQGRSPFKPKSLVPTCSAAVSSNEVSRVVRLLIAKKFFDLPSRDFVVGDLEDLATAQVHTINVVRGKDTAGRSFAAGIYNGEQQVVPADFLEVEKGLRELEDALFAGKTCHVAAPLPLKMTVRVLEID